MIQGDFHQMRSLCGKNLEARNHVLISSRKGKCIIDCACQNEHYQELLWDLKTQLPSNPQLN